MSVLGDLLPDRLRGLAIALVAVAVTLGSGCARADSHEPYLVGDVLVATIAGATLIGSTWAEYYTPDGIIVGKVKYLGFIRDFTGKWFAKGDQVCFEYERSEYNTCSKFRLFGDRMRHFGADGKPKRDPESRRLAGNRLEEFR